MIPCVLSEVINLHRKLCVSAAAFARGKIISVDITLFQTKTQGLFTRTHAPEWNLKIFWGHIYIWQSVYSSGEVRRQFKNPQTAPCKHAMS